jgi:1-acyl-sn-glycerol-3-phosphate acyltransferase
MTLRPNPLPRFHVWLTNGLQDPLMLVLTAVCASTAFLVSVVDKSGRNQHRIAHFWGRNMVRLSFSPLSIVGAENFRKFPVAVYVSNHTSYMDTPVIFGSLPFQFRILAKKDLWKWPMIGWYLGRSGQMPIDLENPQATLSSLGGAVKALRGGMSLFVFPEGGRTSTGALQPFFPGAAYLAIRSQVPIVPIALSGVYDLLPIHTRHFFPCKLTVRVGEPIDTKNMTVRQNGELTEQVRAAIEAMLDQPAQAQSETVAPVA